ncbi:MAG: DUF4058 family protein [Planctomycetes bacterium]|nr:DUF4058 family protein [Planctomycetota bacterium]
MHCPFPGMDPYLERSEIWPDFHDRLTTHISEALQPFLRPRYVALTRDRLYVVEADRPIYPDVSVLETRRGREGAELGGQGARASTLTADRPVVVDLFREEVREPVIHIVEPAAGNRIITAIEVLSPDNKVTGPGRDSYLEKREELWSGGASLVEIDLLRQGESTVRVPREKIASLGAWRYMVAVSRFSPPRREIYARKLEERLPRVAVPLASGDADALLDLEAAFERTWDAGPYPELLRYGEAPPGELTPEEKEWCRKAIEALRAGAEGRQ